MAKTYNLSIEVSGNAPEDWRFREMVHHALNKTFGVAENFYVERVKEDSDVYDEGYAAGVESMEDDE